MQNHSGYKGSAPIAFPDKKKLSFERSDTSIAGREWHLLQLLAAKDGILDVSHEDTAELRKGLKQRVYLLNEGLCKLVPEASGRPVEHEGKKKAGLQVYKSWPTLKYIRGA